MANEPNVRAFQFVNTQVFVPTANHPKVRAFQFVNTQVFVPTSLHPKIRAFQFAEAVGIVGVGSQFGSDCSFGSVCSLN